MFKKIDIKIMIAIGILLLGSLYIFISGISGSPVAFTSAAAEVGFESTGIRLSYDYSSNLSSYATENGFFFCSKDGIRFINNRGDTRFDYTLNLSLPRLAGGGGLAAVAEGGGKVLYVFNEDGLLYTKSYDEANQGIVSFSINEIGYVSVIVRTGSDYNIFVYNSSGQEPAGIIFQDRNLFPVASHISNDGQILAVSSVDINSIHVESDIRLYYTREDVAGSLTDGLFGTITGLEGQIIARLNFMADNYLISISGSHITSIATGTDFQAATKWSYEFDNEISHVAFPDENTVVVATGKPLVNRESAYEEGVLLFFNIHDGLVSVFETGSEITFLSGSLGAVIAGGGNIGRSFTAVNTRGRVLWTYNATQDVKDIQFLNRTDRILFISSLQLDVKELRRIQNNDPGGIIDIEFEDNSDLNRRGSEEVGASENISQDEEILAEEGITREPPDLNEEHFNIEGEPILDEDDDNLSY